MVTVNRVKMHSANICNRTGLDQVYSINFMLNDNGSLFSEIKYLFQVFC